MNSTRNFLSERATRLIQAEIRSMTIECERLGGINLAQGVCDTEVPLSVRRGAQDAVESGINSYTRYDGLPEIRHALAEKLRRDNRIQADPDSQIVVTSGSTGAFYAACLALLDQGDEVILFEPYYGYHLNTLLAVGAAPAFVNTTPPEWTFSSDTLDDALTPRTKGIMICTPSNPSGKVFTREEILEIAAFADRHNLIIFTDEIYEYFVYDGRQHLSPASIPELAERCVTISGYSKTFSITGWRIGYAVCRADWARMIGYLSDLVYVCAPAPLQAGVAAGIRTIVLDFYEALVSEYAQKRDSLCNALRSAGFEPHVPQGAYYVLADADRLPGDTAKAKAMHLLETTGVAAVPGDAFYRSGAGSSLLRFCFAKKHGELSEACGRLERLK